MPASYRKVVSEKPRRKRNSYPEAMLAAELAGVKPDTAYRVCAGKKTSEKVTVALRMARRILKEEWSKDIETARKKVHGLKAVQQRIRQEEAQRRMARARTEGDGEAA
jgi:hypothetical protein